MRSYGTTHTPRRPARVPLWLIVRGDDHPKACTGRRLVRLGTVRRFPRAGTPTAPIALDPFAPVVLSRRDRGHAERQGILVVDCSWNRLSERGELDPGWPLRDLRRRLPFLRATNPQHFGRVGELNSAEAFAAALTVLGHEGEARELLAPFHGAEAFFSVNRELLDRYAAARSVADAMAAERDGFAGR